MQDHANKRQDQTFLIMFFMICWQYVNSSKGNNERCEAISLFLPGLLVLVDSAIENEGNSKVDQVQYGDMLVWNAKSRKSSLSFSVDSLFS